jgi:pyrimidine deaminase RibD-like protein
MDQPVTKPFAPEPAIQTLDLEMMERCIDLSRVAGTEGELPFAALITEKGKIIVEATNRVSRDGDITRHAELLALFKCRTLRNVFVSHARGADRPRRLFDQVANHGRLLEMEPIAGRRALEQLAASLWKPSRDSGRHACRRG